MPKLVNQTVGDMFKQSVKRFPNCNALEYNGFTWTYKQLNDEVEDMEQKLLCMGIERGTHVAIYSEAIPTAIFMFYALQRIGAITVMINTRLAKSEVKRQLQLADVEYLVVGDGFYGEDYQEIVYSIFQEERSIKAVLYIGENMVKPGFISTALPLPLSFNLEEEEKKVSPDDTAFILFTSGTTSAPKAVLDTHKSRVNSAIQPAIDLRASQKDKVCLAIPMFHCFCISASILATCYSGACLYMPTSRSSQDLVQSIGNAKCTILSTVPTLFHAMISREDFGEYDYSSLRTGIIGGNLYPAELFKEVEEKLNFTLLSSLGQTEATAGITTSSLDDSLEVRSTTVGKLMDNVEGKIVNITDGTELPDGEAGELCVKGYIVMKGYYKLAEDQQNMIDEDGWLHTGDLGYFDEEKNIHLTGRLKELIIRGGENICPAEIENSAKKHPAVANCKAIGVPDFHYGETVALCVELKDGCDCEADEITAVIAEDLADYKVPKYVFFVEQIPVSPTGKVQIVVLKQMIQPILDNLEN